ncbi:ciliogenesis and planar polarity effector 1-like [Dendronephthya gigantea]|uniref:ciliogenesis and planar polarity effector 1-like n=1 Tax=Dendronephthya gigantea TaxID=151771 RepID=UPI00106B8AF7|nr:ciliogenesis and planar polarity effector 1-like [Dendronephthya gigantea]
MVYLFWMANGSVNFIFLQGKTKKKIAKLHTLMDDVCALNVSQNGQFLCGALCDGKIFLWDRDKVQFITGLPKVFNEADKGNSKNRIFLSSCGSMLLLMIGFEKLFLWQKTEKQDSDNSHNIIGTWSQVHHGEYSLPSPSCKEATVDCVLYSDEIVGRCGALSYVFNKGPELAVTTLIVKSRDEMMFSNLAHNILNQDEETTSPEVVESVRCSIKWKSLTAVIQYNSCLKISERKVRLCLSLLTGRSDSCDCAQSKNSPRIRD